MKVTKLVQTERRLRRTCAALAAPIPGRHTRGGELISAREAHPPWEGSTDRRLRAQVAAMAVLAAAGVAALGYGLMDGPPKATEAEMEATSKGPERMEEARSLPDRAAGQADGSMAEALPCAIDLRPMVRHAKMALEPAPFDFEKLAFGKAIAEAVDEAIEGCEPERGAAPSGPSSAKERTRALGM